MNRPFDDSTTGLHSLRDPNAVEADSDDSLAPVRLEMERRTNPARIDSSEGWVMPWTPAARTQRQAVQASLNTRLDLFKDDLQALRASNEALNRAAASQAIQAADNFIFEIRCRGEAMRMELLTRAHLEMTRLFVQHLERLEEFRGRVSPEVLDALKERALNELSARMNRASKSDPQRAESPSSARTR